MTGKAMARAAALDVNEVPDGYVIYQTDRDRVHYLNATATIIFEFCDGLQTAEEIVEKVAAAFELPAARQPEITACLENLRHEGLVVEQD